MCNKKAVTATYSQKASGIKNLWWVKVTVPAKTLYILNAEVGTVTNYISVRHDMMRQTNDCSPVRVTQHKVNYFSRSTQLLGLRPSGWVDLELCPRVWYNPAPNLGL